MQKIKYFYGKASLNLDDLKNVHFCLKKISRKRKLEKYRMLRHPFFFSFALRNKNNIKHERETVQK